MNDLSVNKNGVYNSLDTPIEIPTRTRVHAPMRVCVSYYYYL
jgi:hypothetical protein